MSGAVREQRESGGAAGYAGPVGMLAGRPDGQTNTEWTANAITGGIKADEVNQRVGARQAQAQADDEKRRIQAQLDQRNANVRQLNALFGIGDGNDAMANQKRLADYLDRYYRAFLDSQLGQVDRQYGDATRRTRQNLARVGQLGSGLDTNARRESLSDYLHGRQQAVVRASQAREALDSSLHGQRLSLEQQLNAGTVANPDYASYLRQQQQTIDQAQAAIPANTIGQVFDVAGEAYRNGRLQEAQGNQGLNAYFGGGGAGGSSRGGRIT
jgi:hypothetical protein